MCDASCLSWKGSCGKESLSYNLIKSTAAVFKLFVTTEYYKYLFLSCTPHIYPVIILYCYRKHQQGSIQVDDEEPVISNSEQDTQQLDTDGFLWVGGRSNIPWGLPVTNNFVGCIEYVEVNGQRLHFIEDHSKHSTAITFCT